MDKFRAEISHIKLPPRVLPFVVGDNLEALEQQPEDLSKNPVKFANLQSSEGEEFHFRRVCNGFSVKAFLGGGPGPDQQPEPAHKCHYLHHFDPRLRLGPFKIEVASADPYLIVIHEIFTEAEMDFIVRTSRPNLSRMREVPVENTRNARHEYKGGRKRRIVAKSVQHWIADVEYEHLEEDPMAPDDNWNYTIADPVMYKLSKKLEAATGLDITGKYSSTSYQTTNYGLGGLCETHIDPHGYIEGAELPYERQMLVRSGDMFATIMGWMSDPPVGGATAFIKPMKEVTVWPTKGSAAFWYDLDRKGYRDLDTLHGGCPVLKGTKWILNKWIYYYNQWPKYTCSLEPREKVRGFKGLY